MAAHQRKFDSKRNDLEFFSLKLANSSLTITTYFLSPFLKVIAQSFKVSALLQSHWHLSVTHEVRMQESWRNFFVLFLLLCKMNEIALITAPSTTFWWESARRSSSTSNYPTSKRFTTFEKTDQNPSILQCLKNENFLVDFQQCVNLTF